jgi:hypothetical protein
LPESSARRAFALSGLGLDTDLEEHAAKAAGIESRVDAGDTRQGSRHLAALRAAALLFVIAGFVPEAARLTTGRRA